MVLNQKIIELSYLFRAEREDMEEREKGFEAERVLLTQPNARIYSFLCNFFIGNLTHDCVIDHLMISSPLGIDLSMVGFRL